MQGGHHASADDADVGNAPPQNPATVRTHIQNLSQNHHYNQCLTISRSLAIKYNIRRNKQGGYLRKSKQNA